MPYVCSQAGWLAGPILTLSIAVLMSATLYTISTIADYTRANNYSDMVRGSMGRPFYIMSEIGIISYMFFACSSFLVIIGDSFQGVCHIVLKWLAEWLFAHENAKIAVTSNSAAWGLAVCAGSFMVLPISLRRRIAELEHWALFGITMVCGIVVLVVHAWSNWDGSAPPGGALKAVGSPQQLLGVIPTIVFALQCHITAPRIYRELRQEDKEVSWGHVLCCTFAISVTFCGVVGSLGYQMFGNDVPHNIVNQPLLSSLMRIFVGAQSCVGYVINQFAAREALYELICETNVEKQSLLPTRPLREANGSLPYFWGSVLAGVFNLAATLAALTFRDLNACASFTGGTIGAFVIFIIPGACLFRLQRRLWYVALFFEILGVALLYVWSRSASFMES